MAEAGIGHIEAPARKIEEWAKHHPAATGVMIAAGGFLAYRWWQNKHRQVNFGVPISTSAGIPTGAMPVGNYPGGGGGYGYVPPTYGGYYQRPYGGGYGLPSVLNYYGAKSFSTLPAACDASKIGKCRGVFGCIGNFFAQVGTCAGRIVQTGALYAGSGFAQTGQLAGFSGGGGFGGGSSDGYITPQSYGIPEGYGLPSFDPYGNPMYPDYNSMPQYDQYSPPIAPSGGMAQPGIGSAVYNPAAGYASVDAVSSNPGLTWI